MPVEYKDYYSILGVTKTASDDEIKKAFRKLARQYHPDVATNKKIAEEKFKEINEANEVLSDPEKRRKYNELGANWDRPERQASSSPSGGFDQHRGDGAEFHFDGTGFSDFFEQFFGSRTHPFSGYTSTEGDGIRDERFPQHGQDIQSDILVTLEEALHGSTRELRLRRNYHQNGQATTETLRVKIPSGVREGQLIRLAGKGEEGIGGGNSGNLYLKVVFAKHVDFRVQGVNLYYELDLAPWEAVLGAKVAIPTLDGMVTLKVPPGTVSGREFRLRGKGLPTGKEGRGDLHAVVDIQVPSLVTAEEKVLWEQLSTVSGFNPRKGT